MTRNEPMELSARLTWDPVYPFPFESAWSIFAKMVAYNNVSLEECIRLVALPGKMVKFRHNWRDSAWVDFTKFSQVLGVEEKRLRQGFLDQLGFCDTSRPTYSVKHCDKCAANYFHCVFFDLDIIAECPIHESPLREPCERCSLRVTFRPDELSGVRGARQCKVCGVQLAQFSQLFVPTMCVGARELIEARGKSLVNWWTLVGQTIASRDTVLSHLSLVGQTLTAQELVWRRCELGVAVGIWPAIISEWKFTGPPITSELAIWDTVSIPADDVDERCMPQSEAGLGYRSLRRFIQRRYLGQHKKCLGLLLKTDVTYATFLSGENICPVAMAFVAWRVSIEGALAVALGAPHSSRHRKLRMYLAAVTPLSAGSMLKFLMYEFFSIWQRIDELRRESNIRLRYGFTYSPNFSAQYVRPDGFNRNTVVTTAFCAVYPSPLDLERRAASYNCETRNSGRLVYNPSADALPYFMIKGTHEGVFFYTRAQHAKSREYVVVDV